MELGVLGIADDQRKRLVVGHPGTDQHTELTGEIDDHRRTDSASERKLEFLFAEATKPA